MTRVLIVEDESAIAESLLFALRRDGFTVTHESTLHAAESQLTECDLVVLDLMLPDGSGFDLLAKLRALGQRTPVIILTSRDDEADRVAGLEGGADDYVVKPFSPREVVARIRAVLRRTSPAWANIPAAVSSSTSGRTLRPTLATALQIDNDTRRALFMGKLVDLTRTEFELLRVLHGAPHLSVLSTIYPSGSSANAHVPNQVLKKRLPEAAPHCSNDRCEAMTFSRGRRSWVRTSRPL